MGEKFKKVGGALERGQIEKQKGKGPDPPRQDKYGQAVPVYVFIRH